MQKILIPVFGLLSLLSSLANAEQAAAMLVYKVWEQGAPPYISRMLVIDDYVRLDEGLDTGDFTLFDRRQEIIYNVAHSNQMVLVIAPGAVELPDQQALILSETSKVDDKAPQISGVAPRQVELLANGELCSQLVVVPGLMESALQGLRDLKLVLARVQAKTLSAMPLEFQSACDLAMNVQAPTRSLDQGMPIQETGMGRRQVLLDFTEQHTVADALFDLPSDYGRMGMPGI